MRLQHESLPAAGFELPEPDQLFTLASRGVLLAKQHSKFRKNPRTPHARSHFIIPPEEAIIPTLNEAPIGTHYERRITARVARTDFRYWSMRLCSTYFVLNDGICSGGERHTYSFEWNRERSTIARHSLVVVPTPDLELADLVEGFSADSMLATEWDWRTQLEQVSSGDVDLLVREVESYIEPQTFRLAA